MIHGLSSPDKALWDYKTVTCGMGPSVVPRFFPPLLVTMSASDVLRQFVKRDATSQESRRALDEFLRSPCYNYFLKTLEGSDVLGYADFLDNASAELGRNPQILIGFADVEFDSGDGEALDKLFGRTSTHM